MVRALSNVCQMSDKYVCGAVDELPIATLGTSLQQATAAISPSTTTACMGCFKLAVYNRAALQSLSAATPAPQPIGAAPRMAATELAPVTQSDGVTGLATFDTQAFHTAKFASTAATAVVSYPDQATTVVTIVHTKVAKPSHRSATPTMLAIGGYEKSGSASTQPVQQRSTRIKKQHWQLSTKPG